MNNDTKIISLIKQTKWKSFEKLYPIVKQKYPKLTSKILKHLIDNNINHDIKTPVKYNSKFNKKIVSNHRHSYQMDIFVNNTKNNSSFLHQLSIHIILFLLILIPLMSNYIIYKIDNQHLLKMLLNI
jgi:hypothetical protein